MSGATRRSTQLQAGDYVELLKAAYQASKAVDPSIIIISAGLSPTGWSDETARPDDLYLNWMYEAGAEGVLRCPGRARAGLQGPAKRQP